MGSIRLGQPAPGRERAGERTAVRASSAIRTDPTETAALDRSAAAGTAFRFAVAAIPVNAPAIQRMGNADQVRSSPSLLNRQRPNRTGLPDRLKSGIEVLSGLAMDEVRVHYNSTEPARVNAMAYTRQADIHVAPGQERHLPHEAWHVVQQKRGQVRPNYKTKLGILINDERNLEQEADIMGARALANAPARYQPIGGERQNNRDPMSGHQPAEGGVVQGMMRRLAPSRFLASTAATVTASRPFFTTNENDDNARRLFSEDDLENENSLYSNAMMDIHRRDEQRVPIVTNEDIKGDVARYEPTSKRIFVGHETTRPTMAHEAQHRKDHAEGKISSEINSRWLMSEVRAHGMQSLVAEDERDRGALDSTSKHHGLIGAYDDIEAFSESTMPGTLGSYMNVYGLVADKNADYATRAKEYVKTKRPEIEKILKEFAEMRERHKMPPEGKAGKSKAGARGPGKRHGR